MPLESAVKPEIVYEAKALPYEYDALEPIMTKEMLEEVYGNYKDCVKNLNDAQYTKAQARENLENYAYFSYWEREIAKGKFLFSVYERYWSILAPIGLGGMPGRKTVEVVRKSMSSFKCLKEHFVNAGVTINGQGWVILAYLSKIGKVKIFQLEEGEYIEDSINPILPCYIQKEEAYADLSYGRREFLDHWGKIVNWYEVENRLVQVGRGLEI